MSKELSDLWAEMDRLAQEVSAQWTGSPDAVEAVLECRRELCRIVADASVLTTYRPGEEPLPTKK